MQTQFRRSLVLVVFAASVLAVAPLLNAKAATTAPRLAGQIPTSLTMTLVQNWHTTLRAGDHAVKTWTFTPQCASGGCTTLLKRPSITEGSTNVYEYTLKPVSAHDYRGVSKTTIVNCFLTNGTEIANAYTQVQTLTLHVARASRGKAVSYTGTNVNTSTPNATGRGERRRTGIAARHLQGLRRLGRESQRAIVSLIGTQSTRTGGGSKAIVVFMAASGSGGRAVRLRCGSRTRGPIPHINGRTACAIGRAGSTAAVRRARRTSTGWGDTTIGRAGVDGTGKNDAFIDPGADIQLAGDLAVDSSHIYFTEAHGCSYGTGLPPCVYEKSIGRADLDGGNVDQQFIATGSDSVDGLRVDPSYDLRLDEQHRTIVRARLDGTHVSRSFIRLDDTPCGIAVWGRYLYWTGYASIGRAYLDGTHVNPYFINNLNRPCGLAVG